jgi:predicted N-acetyltransferase YhbS
MAKENVKNFEDLNDIQKQIKEITEDEKKSEIFFVKDKNKIVAFGILKPVKIKYLGNNYNILGISNILSVKKKKGYGKKLMQAMIEHAKKKGKTLLGFCGKQNVKFYKKSGLKSEKNFIRRFVYKNPKTGKKVVDKDGDGIYYEGKDKFISKVMKTKSIVYIDIMHW